MNVFPPAVHSWLGIYSQDLHPIIILRMFWFVHRNCIVLTVLLFLLVCLQQFILQHMKNLFIFNWLCLSLWMCLWDVMAVQHFNVSVFSTNLVIMQTAFLQELWAVLKAGLEDATEFSFTHNTFCWLCHPVIGTDYM